MKKRNKDENETDLYALRKDEEIRIFRVIYNDNILDFARYLSEKNKKMWVRFVCVPNVTDNEEELKEYGAFLGELKNVEALDVLPYHLMGVKKLLPLVVPLR